MAVHFANLFAQFRPQDIVHISDGRHWNQETAS